MILGHVSAFENFVRRHFLPEVGRREDSTRAEDIQSRGALEPEPLHFSVLPTAKEALLVGMSVGVSHCYRHSLLPV